MTLAEQISGPVLRHLAGGEMSGRDLRAALADEGHRTRLVPFYAAMAALEADGLVSRRIETTVIDGIEIRESWYRH
jgi:hypothetical protein